MKKHLVFVDANDNMVCVDFETERGYISLTGDCPSGSGVIYDVIEPRTDLQTELVDVWKENHLKNDEPSLVEKISALMDKVQKENDEFYESLLQGDEFPNIDDETACLKYLEKCGYIEPDASSIYAAIKANDYDLRVVPYVDTDESYSLYTIVKIFGVEYNVCKEDNLDDIATKYLKDDDELWREAVRGGSTTMGLDDWVDEVVSIDGAMSVLAWSEVDTVEVDGTDYIVAVRD
jgi:hypothetical protein